MLWSPSESDVYIDAELVIPLTEALSRIVWKNRDTPSSTLAAECHRGVDSPTFLLELSKSLEFCRPVESASLNEEFEFTAFTCRRHRADGALDKLASISILRYSRSDPHRRQHSHAG